MEPSAQACIPAVYSRLIAQELGMRAPDLTALLSETTITPEQLLDEETRLTPGQQIQIARNALRLSGDPSFGMRLGRRLTPAVHGPMGFVASSSPDLATALEARGNNLSDEPRLVVETAVPTWNCPHRRLRACDRLLPQALIAHNQWEPDRQWAIGHQRVPVQKFRHFSRSTDSFRGVSASSTARQARYTRSQQLA